MVVRRGEAEPVQKVGLAPLMTWILVLVGVVAEVGLTYVIFTDLANFWTLLLGCLLAFVGRRQAARV